MKKALSVILSAIMLICSVYIGFYAYAASENTQEFTFSEEGISVKNDTEKGYTINEKSLTLTASGVYRVSGKCSNANIRVAKGVKDIELILDALELSSSKGAPVSFGKSSKGVLFVENEVVLTDNENPEDEKSANKDIADAFDGAAIKVKRDASLLINGSGKLIINGKCKNGIKGSTGSSIELADGIDASFTVKKNALSSDGAIIVSGGKLNINAGNDGINSSLATEITGGVIKISAGDDAIHSDTALNLGVKGSDSSYPDITVENANEGLEASTVNIYCGKYSIKTKDDGINAAGDVKIPFDKNEKRGGNLLNENILRLYPVKSYESNVSIYGGELFINAENDGIDSNGNIFLYGGNIIVWGMAAGTLNEPLDADGTVVIKGATVFAASCLGMGSLHLSYDSQNYILNTYPISVNEKITVGNNDNTVYKTKALKKCELIFYSSPLVSSGWYISAGRKKAYAVQTQRVEAQSETSEKQPEEEATVKNGTTAENKTAVNAKDRANTLTVKVKKPFVKYKKLKKKKQVIARKKWAKVSKAQGRVTYKKIKGNKKIAVNKKTGKITLKKGLKKRTYKVKIKVTAAGNSAYEAKTKTVTVTIKVK